MGSLHQVSVLRGLWSGGPAIPSLRQPATATAHGYLREHLCGAQLGRLAAEQHPSARLGRRHEATCGCGQACKGCCRAEQTTWLSNGGDAWLLLTLPAGELPETEAATRLPEECATPLLATEAHNRERFAQRSCLRRLAQFPAQRTGQQEVDAHGDAAE